MQHRLAVHSPPPHLAIDRGWSAIRESCKPHGPLLVLVHGIFNTLQTYVCLQRSIPDLEVFRAKDVRIELLLLVRPALDCRVECRFVSPTGGRPAVQLRLASTTGHFKDHGRNNQRSNICKVARDSSLGGWESLIVTARSVDRPIVIKVRAVETVGVRWLQ